jgi:ribosomal protein S6
MFIVDSAKAKEDYQKALDGVIELITKVDGEVVDSMLWDDRRLAYPIGDCKRGAYYLIHFNAEGEAIAKLNRAVGLSKHVVRALILLDDDGIETETGSAKAKASLEIKA